MIPFLRKELQEVGDDTLRKGAGARAAMLYHKAFLDFGPRCFWSTREMATPCVSDVLDAASRLKREGNMTSRRLALQMEEACLADL
jgi:hypothetical protein